MAIQDITQDLAPNPTPAPGLVLPAAPATAPADGSTPAAPATLPAPAPPASGFAQRFGQAQKQILSDPQTADVALNQPGGWAKSVLLSVTHALAPPTGFGEKLRAALSTAADGLQDASSGTPEGGWISAVTGTLKNRADRLAGQRQQQFQNDLKTKESQRQDQMLSLEQQRTQAQMAASQAEEVLHAKMSRNADLEYQTNSTKDAQADAQPLLDAGATTTATKQNSDQLQEVLKADAAKGIQDHYFQDGWQPMLGSDGKPMLNKDGEPQMRATWMVVSPVPNGGMVTIDADKAKDWNKLGVTPLPIQAGQELPAADYYRLSKEAQTQRGVQMNVQELQARIAESQSATEANKARTREENLTTEEKQQNIQTAREFAPFLASANGDPILAMQQVAQSKDPKIQKLAGPIEQLYGPGTITKARQDAIADLDKTIEIDNRKLQEHAVPGATPLPADESDDLRDEIKQASTKRNLYLGLPYNSPQHVAGQNQLIAAQPENLRAQYIAAIADPNERAAQYRAFGIAPPPAPSFGGQSVPPPAAVVSRQQVHAAITKGEALDAAGPARTLTGGYGPSVSSFTKEIPLSKAKQYAQAAGMTEQQYAQLAARNGHTIVQDQ